MHAIGKDWNEQQMLSGKELVVLEGVVFEFACESQKPPPAVIDTPEVLDVETAGTSDLLRSNLSPFLDTPQNSRKPQLAMQQSSRESHRHFATLLQHYRLPL